MVHENHGLGIYRGIEKVTVDKVVKDYIKIEYAGNSNLYILATQLDLLQKYAGADARAPKLNKLGGQEWNKTKTKVRGAVKILQKIWLLFMLRDRRKMVTAMNRIRSGKKSLKKCFHLRRRKTS